jgi:carboxypeptidase Q
MTIQTDIGLGIKWMMNPTLYSARSCGAIANFLYSYSVIVRKMRIHKIIFSFCLVILPIAGLPGVRMHDDSQQISSRIAGSILIAGRSMEYTRELSDGFGGRLPGSVSYQRAAEWAAAQFRASGLKDVRLESLTIPNGWQRGSARARMLEPLKHSLHVDSLGWSISTPIGGVNGSVVLLKDITPQAIQSASKEISGHIVMLDTESIFAKGWYMGYPVLINSFQPLKEAGATAVILPSWEPNNLIFRLDANACKATPLPIAQIGLEDAKLIQRLSAKGAVHIEMELHNQVTGPAQVFNVIAEIRGREKPDQWLIVGAHLDSWDAGTGAQDNATGCAMVLESARAISALGRAPLRSIRFALWAGEEEGYLGSLAYVQAHSAELAKCIAVLNTDSGAGQPQGWRMLGRDDVMQAIQPISNTLLTGLGGAELAHDVEFTFYSDHGPFILEGIPALDLKVDMKLYDKVHHLPADTIDKVQPHNLASCAAVVAVTAYAIADRPESIAIHLSHTEVERMLKAGGMYSYVRELLDWQ